MTREKAYCDFFKDSDGIRTIDEIYDYFEKDIIMTCLSDKEGILYQAHNISNEMVDGKDYEIIVREVKNEYSN